MLLGELRKMMMKAKLEKDTVKGNLLSTLVAEAVMVGKNDGNRETTDAETIAMIKKFLKNVNETLALMEEMGKDNTYVESIARAQLDMVYPGEVIFRVSGDKYSN